MQSDLQINVSVQGRGNVLVKKGTTLLELKESLRLEEEPDVPIVGALYNNRIMGLEYPLNRDCSVKYLTTRSEEGADIYRRSLSVLLNAAFIDCSAGQETLKIEHSLNKGYFFSFIDRKPLTGELVKRIEERMRDFVSRDLPFEKYEIEREDALGIFRKIGAWDRYYLLKYDDRAKIILYKFRECYNLAQGPLVPHTGYLRIFSLVHYPPGLVLAFPDTEKPETLPPRIEQKKLFQIYSEHREWSKILDVSSAGKLNRLIIKGKINDLIWVSEGLHEKKIAQIADIITRNAKTKRIVMLAGPSSSGKTTFAKRLIIQMGDGIVVDSLLGLLAHLLSYDGRSDSSW